MVYPPFFCTVQSSGALRNFTGGERQLSLLPLRRPCMVNKVLSALERREQYRQAVLTVERGVMASTACVRCRSTRGERTFSGCYFTSVFAKCAKCIQPFLNFRYFRSTETPGARSTKKVLSYPRTKAGGAPPSTVHRLSHYNILTLNICR